VFESIFINGTLPDQDSHQFYPTKGDLRQSAVDLAELNDSHSVLDPSAGFRHFLALLPRKAEITAIEIHPVAAA
ncbi:hypothetical protein QIG11_27420, partial [Klebsiella pneumoniae]|nr:hypothetical protein [Klebsiella pneumoniae]